MTKFRVIVIFVLACLGGALASGGPQGIRHAVHVAATHVSLILVIVASLLLLANMAPRGVLAGSLVFAAAALVAWAVPGHIWDSRDRWVAVGGASIAIASVLAMQLHTTWDGDRERVVQLTSLFVPRTASVIPTKGCPERITVRAIGAKAVVDLSAAAIPGRSPVEVMVTSRFGRIEIVVPNSWLMFAGRLAATSRVRMSGRLDGLEPYRDPQGADWKAIEEQTKGASDRAGVRVAAIVVHVAGVGGELTICKA